MRSVFAHISTMFYPLPLLPFFSLFNLGWITDTARFTSLVNETATYDFVVIGGGNAYV